jgi:hypothetical protein
LIQKHSSGFWHPYHQNAQIHFPHLAHLCIAAELRFGVPAPEVRGLIKALPQQAQPLTSTYICLIQEST